MAAGKSLKGIYVAVELDAEKLKSSVTEATSTLKSEFKKLGDDVSRYLNIDTSAVENSLTKLGTSISKLTAFSKAGDFSEAFKKATASSKELEASINKMATSTGVSAQTLQANLERALKAERVSQVVNEFNRYVRVLGLSNAEAIEHAKALKLSSDVLDKINAKYDRLSRNASEGSILGQFKNIMTGGNTAAMIQSSIATLGVNLSVAGMVEFGKAAAQTTIKIDSLRTAYEAIYKDADLASTQLEQVRKTTQELGLEFYSTAEAAKGFFAAANVSGLKDNAQEIFHAFSAASSALKLTQDQTNSVFLAVSQMLSKGKISAEELRQQLAERLPGAVQMLAKAMNVSLSELDKMLQNGEVGLDNLLLLAKEAEAIYGEGGRKAANALLGEVNKLTTAWMDFKSQLIKSDELASLFRGARSIVEWIAEHVEGISRAFKVAAIGLGSYMASFTALGAVQGVTKMITTLTGLRNAWKLAAVEVENYGKKLVVARKMTTALEISSQAAQKAVTALNPMFTLISVGVGIAATAVMALATSTDKSAYSVEQFKKGLPDLKDAMHEVNEVTAQTSDSFRNLFEIQLEKNLKTANEDIKEFSDNLKNSLAAIVQINNANLIEERLTKSGSGGGILGISLSSGDRSALVESQEKAKKNEIELKALIDNANFSSTEGVNAFITGLQNAKSVMGDNADILKVIEGLEDRALYLLGLKEEAERKILAYKKQQAEQLALSGGNEDAIYGDLDKLKKATAKQEALNRFASVKDPALRAEATAFLNSFTAQYKKGTKGEKFEFDADVIRQAGQIATASDEARRNFMLTHNITKEYAEETLKNVHALGNSAKIQNQIANATKKTADESDRRVRIEENWNAKLTQYQNRKEDRAKLSQYDPNSIEYEWQVIENKYSDIRAKMIKMQDEMNRDHIDAAKQQQLLNAFEESENLKKYEERIKLDKKYYDEARNLASDYLDREGEFNIITEKNLETSYENRLKALKEYFENEKVSYEEQAVIMKALADKKNRDELELQKGWQAGLKQGAQALADEVKDSTKTWADFGKSAFEELGNTVADFCTSTDKSWKNLGAAFTDLANSIIKDLARIAAKQMSSQLYTGLFGGSEKGDNGLFGMAASAIGSFFAADGGVMPTGSLSAYSNGVYNTPHYFEMSGSPRRFARGGVFGEAGPEAIMPLTTLPNGRLGVESTGRSNNDVQVNVYNNSNSQATVRQSKSSSGGKTIDVLIGDVVAKQMVTPGTKLNRSVQSQTGSSQPVTRR